MSQRIFARWVDDPLESPITLDAQIGVDGRIVGHWILFGATGLIARNNRPFTLDADGQIDFGESSGLQDRYWRTDIRSRPIALGEKFSVTWSGGESGDYRIEKIYKPGSKKAKDDPNP